MPADYKYEHISMGRVKALDVGVIEFSKLYYELKESNIISPALIERLRKIKVFLDRAAGGRGISLEDQEFLTSVLGPDMGGEKQQ